MNKRDQQVMRGGFFLCLWLPAVCLSAGAVLGQQNQQDQHETQMKQTRSDLDELLQQDPELASDPALLAIVRQDLSRYEQGELKPSALWDPVASELEMVERLKSEGISQQEAQEIARRFHALRENLLSAYGEARPDQEGLKGRRFQEFLEQRMAIQRRQEQRNRPDPREQLERQQKER